MIRTEEVDWTGSKEKLKKKKKGSSWVLSFLSFVDVVKKHAGESYQASTGRKRTARTGHLCTCSVDSAWNSTNSRACYTVDSKTFYLAQRGCWVLATASLSLLLVDVAELRPSRARCVDPFLPNVNGLCYRLSRPKLSFFTSLVIPGLNLPFRTVVLFTASSSCFMNMTSWTSSAVQFRFLIFFTTVSVRGSSFFFFVFLFLMLNWRWLSM